MTIEQMKEGFDTIKLLEKDLMRDLTKEEKEIVMTEGWNSFLFKHLCLTEDEYKEMMSLKAIISAFYTQDEVAFKQAVKDSPESIYFVLKDIMQVKDSFTLCRDTDTEDRCGDNGVSAADTKEACSPVESNPAVKEDVEEDKLNTFVKYIMDLYKELPLMDSKWFDKATEKDFHTLFDVYKGCRNEQQDCTNSMLDGIMTDAIKDEVIKDMVERLKKGEAIEMTNDEYMEVADYLCQTEDHIFLSNENGTVRLTIL